MRLLRLRYERGAGWPAGRELAEGEPTSESERGWGPASMKR